MKKHISSSTVYKHRKTSIALDKFSIVEGETLKCPWPVRSNRIETIQISYKQRSQNSFTKQLCFNEALTKVNLVILNLNHTHDKPMKNSHRFNQGSMSESFTNIFCIQKKKTWKESEYFFKKIMPKFYKHILHTETKTWKKNEYFLKNYA